MKVDKRGRRIFAFTSKSTLHPHVLVSDERVDQFGDVTQIPPHCPTVETREQNSRIELHPCDETVSHKNKRRDVFDFIPLKDAVFPERWTPFLAVLAVRARERHSFSEVERDFIGSTKTTGVQDESRVHQSTVENGSASKVLLVDILLKPKHCLLRYRCPNPFVVMLQCYF